MINDLRGALLKGLRSVCAFAAPDGSFCFPLESDASTTAWHVLCLTYMSRGFTDEERRRRIAYFDATSLPEGGWPLRPGGQADRDVSLLCWAALSCLGTPSDHPAMRGSVLQQPLRERSRPLPSGWPVRTMLCLTGFLPAGFLPGGRLPYFTSRMLMERKGTIPVLRELGILALGAVPMIALCAPEACRKPSTLSDLREQDTMGWGPAASDWPKEAFATLIGTAGRLLDWNRSTEERHQAVLRWLTEEQGENGTWGGLLMPTCLSLMALDGIAAAGPSLIERGLEGARGLEVCGTVGTWSQFSKSTTHDTAYALRAIVEAPGGQEWLPAALHALEFLTVQGTSVAERGRRHPWWPAPPGGWTFGEAGAGYPDSDVTALVLWALLPLRDRCGAALEKGVDWLLSMQGADGGWAAYAPSHSRWANRVVRHLLPQGLERSDVDVSARVLRVLSAALRAGVGNSTRILAALRSGIRFLWEHQEGDGSWRARWTTGLATGTAEVIRTLSICGVGEEESRFVLARRWLESARDPDGGWGESGNTRRSGSGRGAGEPGATAVAVLALLEGATRIEGPVEDGLAYLLASQNAEGMWDDSEWAGVIVPGRQYCSYRFAATCLALQAIGKALQVVDAASA